jgi:hypothetical protein
MGLAHLGLGDVYYYNTKQYAEAAKAYKQGLNSGPATRLRNTTSAGVTTISNVMPKRLTNCARRSSCGPTILKHTTNSAMRCTN